MPAARALTVVLAALVSGVVALPVPAPAEVEKFTVDSDQSRVLFDAFHPWTIGRFSAGADKPTGEFEIDVDDLRKSIKGTLVVQASAFRSGRAGRDKSIRKALDAEHNPEIRYRIEKVDSSFPSLAENNDVWKTIISIAKKKKCDLICMASHGRRGLSGVLLGSETHKVLTHSDLPVLVLR